jgi:hypothetical protein
MTTFQRLLARAPRSMAKVYALHILGAAGAPVPTVAPTPAPTVSNLEREKLEKMARKTGLDPNNPRVRAALDRAVAA